MSIAEVRRAKSNQKANLYRNLAVGTGFVLLGNLSSYPSLRWGSFVLLAIALLAVEFKAIVATLSVLNREPNIRKEQVTQKLSVLGVSFLLPCLMFGLGRLI